MGMKNKQHLLALMTMAMMFESNKEDCGYYDDEEKKEAKTIIPKKHKEFFYGLNSVFALNQKNADKKAKAKGYL